MVIKGKVGNGDVRRLEEEEIDQSVCVTCSTPTLFEFLPLVHSSLRDIFSRLLLP